MLSQLASKYAKIYHEGQERKQSNLPYIVHPACVVSLLESFNIKDEETKAIGWLHDTLEDTSLSYNEIEKVFGVNVAQGVKYLTRDVCNEEYKLRLAKAPSNVQKVKLCDVIDNTRTISVYRKEKIIEKVHDCMSFYIPLARKIDMRMARVIEENIKNYS